MPMKMVRGSLLVTFLLLVCSICSSWSVSFSVFVRKDEAHQVLKIRKRANHFLEEIHAGNLERECIEETCSFEEAKEIFQSQEKTMEFWFDYKDLNPCKETPCKNGGVCKLKHYDYFCICPPMFGGKQCELEKFECWYKNGGCWQYCQDTAGSLRVVCSCAEGYVLNDDGKRCMQSAQFPCGLIKRSMRVLEEDDPGLHQLAEGGTVRLNGMAEGDALRLKESMERGNPGLNGTAERGAVGLNELAEGDTLKLNDLAEGGTPRLNELAEGGRPGLNRTAERGALRLNESVEWDNTGLNGTAERGAPGLNESAEGGSPGLNGTAERGAPGLNESAEGGSPGLNGTAERGAPGLNESAEGGSPGLNGTAERGAPGLNESAEGGSPGLNGTAERGALRLNDLVEGGSPGLNGTAERGAPRLNESVEGDNTGLNGMAERGAPGLNELAEGGRPGLSGTAERGALRLNESVEGDNTGLNGTAERGAPGLNESAEGGSPELNGTAERGAPGLNGSAEGQNVHDGLSQAEAEGTLTDGDLRSWISSYYAAEHADTKITAGSFCHRGHCPWQVFIRNSRDYGFCGGSLISSRWVVTAAHCIDITRPHHVTVGDFDKHQREVKEQKIEVQQSWTHPHYDSDNYNGDIALLYLRSEVVFNEYVLPICLPNPNLATLLTAEGTKGMVSGWGATYHKGPTTRFLMKVKLPIVSMETCRQSTEKLITDNMFCAGYAVSAQDACKGDSGGPFAVSYRNTWYLLGIVSWGEGCAEEGKYGAYTRVANYVPWIKEIVENTAHAEEVLRSL